MVQKQSCLEVEKRILERALLGEIARAHPWQTTSKADSPAILVACRLKSLSKTKQPNTPGRFTALLPSFERPSSSLFGAIDCETEVSFAELL
jgi:hypothetical protein